jgi:hypothetical protein
MATALFIKEKLEQATYDSVRLGAGTGAANWLTDKEVGKFVKLVAESRYDLCAVGNPIEGRIAGVESATTGNFTNGSVQIGGLMEVTFDGLQATPGTGTMTIGSFVVCGTVVAKDTALTAPARVCLATHQPGAVPADLTAAGQQARNAAFAWRVVSLGTVGTGAVGTVGVIQRVL